jgi:hypothetical protein
MEMTLDPDKRPWYQVKWQIWLILLILVATATILYLQSNRQIELSITTSGPIGQRKTQKQRMIFAASLEKSFHKRGWPATIDTEGEDGKTLKIYWAELNFSMAEQMVKHQQIVSDIREMGFKQLVLKNDNEIWKIDLKN